MVPSLPLQSCVLSVSVKENPDRKKKKKKGVIWRAQKVGKKCTKRFFILQILFNLFSIWLSAKYEEFLIFSRLSLVLHVFFLFYKNKLKVQHEPATCQFCTNVLHFMLHLFWNFLITVFSLGYTWYLIKGFLSNPLTIWHRSEDGK